MSSHTQANRSRRTSNAPYAWLVAVPAVIIGLALGLWLAAGVLAPGYTTSIVFAIAWFVVAGVLVGRLGARFPSFKLPMRATFLGAAAAAAVGFYWTSIRDDRVNETVATGVAASQVQSPNAAAADRGANTAAPPAPAPTNVEVARGLFETRAHSSRGTAAVVDLAGGGRKLTFTDFETDNGPDLRVYLVRGPVRGDGDVDDVVDLGRLKGNIGNQQYAVPDGVDLAAYSTVVIWCRAFSVSFAQADLRPS